MSFYRLKTDEHNTFGNYVLVLALVLFSFMLGNTVSEKLANHLSGFSLLHLHDGIDRNLILFFSVLPFTFASAAALISVKLILKRPVLTAFSSRTHFSWSRFFLSCSIWIVVLFLFLFLSMASGDQIRFQFEMDSFLPLILIALTLLPLQTLAEDLFFRSLLFQGMSKLGLHPIAAAVVSSVLFGLAHSTNPEVNILGYGVLIYFFMTGFFLSLLSHFDDGLELGLGYHYANNFFGLVILTNEWQSFQTDALWMDGSSPQLGLSTILIVSIVQPALFFLYSRIYRWQFKSKEQG